MPDPRETLGKIQAALREGQTQLADDIATSAVRELQIAEAAAAGLAPPKPAPREPLAIVRHFIELIAARHGNPPELLELLEELDASLAGAK
jgi:hypothetical protein